MTVRCNICLAERGAPAERAEARSNVRAFREERFGVWRCAECGSLHAEQDVDLDHYYSRYPFFTGEVDWRLRVMYRNLLRRLVRAGLKKEHRLLDYGCGGGHFIAYARERGFTNAVGYDGYNREFNRRELLDERYDFILSQDVIEHVPDPLAFLEELGMLANPGAPIALGTPNATGIDLGRPEFFVHALHQPYHRHILSKRALIEAGQKRGWELVRFYPTMYNNTLFPCINPRFVRHYLGLFDDTLDLGFEPPRISLRLFTPITLVWALFGYFFPFECDVMAVFRRP
jgi:2-polyprenyl-3-methyl-5-hydroxy-6-metoxy-1,4-benzoquinol methylase